MGRRRKSGNDLPKNLYERKGYYSYRHPIDGREYGLGKDRAKAILAAQECNRSLSSTTSAMRLAEGLLTLLTKAEIIAAATSLNRTCGVYFLVHDGEVVYVGQSTNVHKRIAVHLTEGEKVFDSFHFVRCPPEILSEVEQSYIATLRPRYNVHLNLKVARASICADLQRCMNGP